MLDPTITLDVGEELAKVYKEASQEAQAKAAVLVRFYLRSLKVKQARPLADVMDEISAKAQSRGMTPEILDDILN